MTPPRCLRPLAVARGVSSMVQGPIRVGYVHSVFRRAANLWLPPDTLLAVTAPTAPRAPNGLVVDYSAGLPEGAFLGLDAEMAVQVSSGVVRVPAAGLCIDLVDVPIWDPRPQFPNRPIAPAVLSQHLDRLAILVHDGARTKPWSLASVLSPEAGSLAGAATLEPREEAQRERLACRVRPAARELLSGIAAGDSNRISAAAGQLAGLGHGLTPSGDDFLIGICGALTLSRRSEHVGGGRGAACCARGPQGHNGAARHGLSACGRRAQQAAPLRTSRDSVALQHALSTHLPEARRDQARAIAAAAASRTTTLSAIWLDHAARGEFSAEVGALLVSLAEPDATGLEEAAARLLAVGELSGLDTAVGVLLGCRAVLSSCQK